MKDLVKRQKLNEERRKINEKKAEVTQTVSLFHPISLINRLFKYSKFFSRSKMQPNTKKSKST